MSEGIDKLGRFLEGTVSVQKENVDHCLYLLSSEESGKIRCNYYLITCTVDDIREKDFVKAISSLIIPYALKREEYAKITPINALEITKKARQRFTGADNSGEIGEIVLFTLLESQRLAPQILNKMSLKTSGTMQYHGIDGIHLSAQGDEIRLYYCESKTGPSYKVGIREAVGDLKKFYEKLEKESFEIDLINNNIDISKFGTHVEEIKKIINPYSKNKENLRKVFAVFVGFNWDSIQKIEFSSITTKIKESLEDTLTKNIDNIRNSCENEVNSKGLTITFEFFFLPFKDVQKIRDWFNESIG